MSKKLIYKETLEKLADQGNILATEALSRAQEIDGPKPRVSKKTVREICAILSEANADLARALSYNEDRWTRQTDYRIEDARQGIVNVLAKLAVE